MADFDEDQHPRDERGRFTGSSISFWASNRQKLAYQEAVKVKGRRGIKQTVAVQDLKKSGISKAEGPAVGRVEGRQRDVEVPLIRKNEGFVSSHSATLTMKDSGQLRPIWDAIHYKGVALDRQKKEAQVAAARAWASYNRAQTKTFVGGSHKYGFNEEGQIVNLHDPNDKSAPAGFEKIKAKRDAAEQKYKDLKREREVLQERGEALKIATFAMSKIAPKLKEGDKVTFATSPDHGWSSVHLERADGSELSVHVEPGHVEAYEMSNQKGAIFWRNSNASARTAEDLKLSEPHVTIETHGPLSNSKDFRWHMPITEGESLMMHPYLLPGMHRHIEDFFKDPEPKEPESNAPNALLEKAKAAPGGGHVWKPGGKTLGDYDK